MKSSSFCIAAACAAALLGAPSPARATGAEEDSKAFFAQGRELRQSGKCTEAIIAFRRALDLYPTGLGALRNVAECEEELRLYAAARRDWWDLRRAAMQSNEARYEGWDKHAEERYRSLEARVGRLTVRLQGSAPGQVRVTLDGVPLDGRLLGVELERDPGAHRVEALYGGAAPITESVTLAEGSRETVTLVLPATDATQGAPRDGGGAAGAQGPSGAGARTAGFVALGVGAAGVVAAGIAIGIRQSALSDLEAGCAAYETAPCPSGVEGHVQTGQTASTLANVFGVVAIAGVGAGVVLLLTAPAAGAAAPGASGRAAAPATEISVAPTLTGAAAALRVRF